MPRPRKCASPFRCFNSSPEVTPGGLFGATGLEKRADNSERLLELYRQRLKDAFGHVSTLLRASRLQADRGQPVGMAI